MRTSLSSAMTLPMKVGFPVVWLGLFGHATWQLVYVPDRVRWQGGGTPPAWAPWAFLAALLVGLYACCRILTPLTRVVLEGDALYVSNYVREVRIPLALVAGAGPVTHWHVNNGPVIAVDFVHATAFGKQLIFLPRSEAAFGLLQAALRAHGSAGAKAELARPAA